MILDDLQVYPTTILWDFMNEDPGWKLYKSFENKTVVFKKIAKSIHNVAWHMQLYVMNRLGKKNLRMNILNNLRNLFSSNHRNLL